MAIEIICFECGYSNQLRVNDLMGRYVVCMRCGTLCGIDPSRMREPAQEPEKKQNPEN